MSEHDSLLPASLWEKHVFNGDWVSSNGPAVMTRSPGNGEELGQVAQAGAEQVSEAARAARAAAES